MPMGSFFPNETVHNYLNMGKQTRVEDEIVLPMFE